MAKTTTTYAEKLRDPRWQKKRLEVMERDHFTCRDCGDKDKTQNVHHCHYFRGAPWDTPSEFLLTLCEECHEIRQQNEEEIKRRIGLALTKVPGRALSNFVKLVTESKNPKPVTVLLTDKLEALKGSVRSAADHCADLPG